MIHLYAEHLLNIRTLSIQASLSTVSNKETKATLSADGSILTLTHEGESASVRLPINLSPNRESTVKLTIPAVPSRELSFRLQLEAREGVTDGVLGSGDAVNAEDGNIIPWTAPSLTSDTEILCRNCGLVLIPRATIRDWKDLPSEGWAEMMDFWHCHKPDEPHAHDHVTSKKAYAAAGQLALQRGVGMTGAMDLLFHANDCTNVQLAHISEDTNKSEAILYCMQCQSTIGRLGQSPDSYQLRKAQISVSMSSEGPPSTHDMEKWLASLLLSAMDNQGLRKFMAEEHVPDHNSISALKIWIFTPDLLISSSQKTSTSHTRVCKILWQDTKPSFETGSEPLTASALSEGTLNLHRGELAHLRQSLEQSSSILPEDAREFQGWHVGLLERFTGGDVK